MSWREIKSTPRIELEGLIQALNDFSTIHNFDGYTSEDVSEMAKSKPQVRSQYMEHMEAKARLNDMLGKTTRRPSVRDITGL